MSDAEGRPDLRETLRTQLIASVGGWQGALITAIPTVVFVIVTVAADLRAAIVAAIGAALVLTVYRLVRRQPVQQALSGLFGVVVAAAIAAWTGQARGYFLVGIWTSFLYAVPFAVSLVVRRPLVGLLWEFIDPTVPDSDVPWHRRRVLFAAYAWSSLAAMLLFLSRGLVQWWLYGQKSTGWLAFAKLVMGYPLFIVVAGVVFLLVTRARKRVHHQPAPASTAESAPAVTDEG